MNRATKITELPALTVDLLNANGVLIDNIFASLWREIGMKTVLSRAGFNKRSGSPMGEVIFGLMLWLWLKKDSIGMFARECLQGGMGKDVLYDTLNREDLNWRKYHGQVAYKTIQVFKADGKKAFVVDDTVAQRFGKKMPGISSHFDHTSGRYMMGQQVLTLGLSCDEGFVPLDSELFISQTKAIALHEPFEDGRSIAAKRYRTAQQWSKPEMVSAMVKRALNAGIVAGYLLADAWFGTKAMIRLSQETSVVPVLVFPSMLKVKRSAMSWIFRRFTNTVCAKPGNRFVGKSTKLRPSMSSLTWHRPKTLNNGLRYACCLFAAMLATLRRLSVSMIGPYS
jgi:DDE superfamily endonuclease